MQKENTNPPILKERIAAWLVLTRNAEPSVGLTEAEAATRAREFFRRILDQSISPGSIALDDETKQVLSVLVRQLRESVTDPERRLREADAVYQFIHRMRWPETEFAEERDLLYDCAEIGWGAVGLTIAEVSRRREAGEPIMPYGKTDPIRISVRSRRIEEPLTPAEAFRAAEEYLALPNQDREQIDLAAKTDVLFAICRLLYERRDSNPSEVAAEAASLFSRIRDSASVGLFDEKDYLLGELALISGNATRQLGRWADSDRWLNRAESCFRHVVNPGPKLAEVAYLRLALRFDQRQFADVLELVPSLEMSFERLEMSRERNKAAFLGAMCLKALSRDGEARQRFDALSQRLDSDQESQLLGQTLIEMGAYEASESRFESALETFGRALQLLKQGDRPILVAHLKATVAETLARQGKLEASVQAYRESISDYASIGVALQAAYLRVLLAEILIQIERHREAEWELLAALPAIEEQKMVPEGFAAVALLKESVRRRKTDPNALRELREHLQKQN